MEPTPPKRGQGCFPVVSVVIGVVLIVPGSQIALDIVSMLREYGIALVGRWLLLYGVLGTIATIA